MVNYLLPVLFVVLAWWAGTALILHLDGLPRATYARSMRQATVAMLIALVGLAWSADSRDTLAAYLAFGSALVVWGWLEMSFLMGFITGPRKRACDESARSWRRFRAALGTLLYHELALLLGGLLVLTVTWRESNQVGLWTYLVLWVMRTSAKLNVFLGVRNLSEAFLPEHLRYLESYFRRAPMNGFFPFAVSLATIILTLMLLRMPAADIDHFGFTGVLLVSCLLFLAVLEHWCMVIPFPVDALWSMGLRSRRQAVPDRGLGRASRRGRTIRVSTGPAVARPLLLAEALHRDLAASTPERPGP
ncbi:MAG: DUF3623 domain-containing protein [Gammaproteobacteria bacterium]|nr:DUF3623 domain-containing protein [Gammaproteobacteria bacterium]